jgi:large subunit ribosomal protein L21
MYAVIKAGGRQYRVSEGDVIRIERVDGEVGTAVTFDQVLMVAEGDRIDVGTPFVANSSVVGEIFRQGKGKKIVVFKAKRRKGYRKKQGHRQSYTWLKIKSVTAQSG